MEYVWKFFTSLKLIFFKELLVINQWRGVKDISCPSKQNCLYTGSSVITYYSMDESNYNIDFIAIVLILVGLRIISFFILFLKSFKR
jgi:hypothetical protein